MDGTGVGQKPRRPPSSCEGNYEWQESSLDLAGDGESINRSVNEPFNGNERDVTTTSSSAESITEDSVSVRRWNDGEEEKGGRSDNASPMNTQL